MSGAPAAYSTARTASTGTEANAFEGKAPGENPAALRILTRGCSTCGTWKELALDDALDDFLLAHLDVAHLDLIARLQLGEAGHGAVLDGHRQLHGLAVHYVLEGHGLGRLIHRHELAGEVLGGRLGRIRG